jgi:pimeloyl-ACP methyl ester carboxylesterase
VRYGLNLADRDILSAVPTIHANGIDIWYERLGSDEGTPLVLTHGFAGPSLQWKPELVSLAEKRPLVLYDVRGHHRTTVPQDPSAYSLPIFAADLAAMLKAIGIERAHIGGVSMGGMVTAQFAVDYPEMCESVLLCDTTCGNATTLPVPPAEPDDAQKWEQTLVVGITLLKSAVQQYGLKQTVLREWEWKKKNDPYLDVSPYSLDDDLERIKLMTPEGHIGSASAIASRPDLTDRITKIISPTLVMIGEWDGFLPCALRDHQLIPGSRLVVRKECAHGSRWRLETFLSEIEAFLDDVESGRPVAGERVV